MRYAHVAILLAVAVGSVRAEARLSPLDRVHGWVQRALPEGNVPQGLRRDGVGYVLRHPSWRQGAKLSTVRPLLEKLPSGWQVCVSSGSTGYYFQSIGWILKNASLGPDAALKDVRVYRPQDLQIQSIAGRLVPGKRQLIAAEEYFSETATVRRYYEPKDLQQLRKKAVVALRVVDLPSTDSAGRELSRLRADELVRVEGVEAKPGTNSGTTAFHGVYRASQVRELLREAVHLKVPTLYSLDSKKDPRSARWTFYRKDRRPLWGSGAGALPRAGSVRQGRLGDCWFVSRVAAVARANKQYTKSMIRERKGGYEVRLFVRTADGDIKPHWIPVSGRLPRRMGWWMHYADSTDGKWVGLIEKAAAKVAGGYGRLGGSASAPDLHGFELLLGQPGEHLASRKLDDRRLLETIHDALRSGKPIVTGSRSGTDALIKKHRVVPYHAYAISGVNLERGTIDLQNPWGRQHVKGLSVAEFKDLYPSFQIGRIPGD